MTNEIRVIQMATCVSVLRGNTVLANFVGPDCQAHAQLFAGALVGSPPPLTDDQLLAMWREHLPRTKFYGAYVRFARDVEAYCGVALTTALRP